MPQQRETSLHPPGERAIATGTDAKTETGDAVLRAMDPPVAAMAAASATSLHEPQAGTAVSVAPSSPSPLSSSSSSSLIDQLLFFDAFGGDTATAPVFSPLGATRSSASIPAHDALMAFLTEMDALSDRDDEEEDEEQQSNDGSSNSTDSEALSAETTAPTATPGGSAQDRGDDELAVVAAEDKGKAKPQRLDEANASRGSRNARQSTTESSGATTTSSMTDPIKKKKRIRAKHEIDMLREDAAVLQRQLELLQSTATPKRGAERQSVLNASTMAPKPSKKPKLRHVGAVEQNRQLRKLVKTQLRYAKQIEKLLMSKSPDGEERSVLISDNAVAQTPLSKADVVVFYEALTGKLDALYMQLDSVFADANLRDSQQFSDVKLVVDDNKYATLQLRDVKTLPFDFESVKDVSWRLLKNQCVKEGEGADELLVADEDVMLMRRALTVQLEEGEPEVEIPTRAVSKRFLSKDRMVFCWDGTTDWPVPSKSEHLDPQFVSLREKGWAVIKPVPGNPGLSTMQMCLLMTPGHSDARLLEMVTKEKLRDDINKFVVPTYQQLFASRYQMAENMLLDEQTR